MRDFLSLGIIFCDRCWYWVLSLWEVGRLFMEEAVKSRRILYFWPSAQCKQGIDYWERKIGLVCVW